MGLIILTLHQNGQLFGICSFGFNRVPEVDAQSQHQKSRSGHQNPSEGDDIWLLRYNRYGCLVELPLQHGIDAGVVEVLAARFLIGPDQILQFHLFLRGDLTRAL